MEWLSNVIYDLSQEFITDGVAQQAAGQGAAPLQTAANVLMGAYGGHYGGAVKVAAWAGTTLIAMTPVVFNSESPPSEGKYIEAMKRTKKYKFITDADVIWNVLAPRHAVSNSNYIIPRFRKRKRKE